MTKLMFETYLLDVLETVKRTVVDKLISEIVDSLIYQTQKSAPQAQAPARGSYSFDDP